MDSDDVVPFSDNQQCCILVGTDCNIRIACRGGTGSGQRAHDKCATNL